MLPFQEKIANERIGILNRDDDQLFSGCVRNEVFSLEVSDLVDIVRNIAHESISDRLEHFDKLLLAQATSRLFSRLSDYEDKFSFEHEK
jgi:hypothetical protein